ncbi:uncharacterized protein LOC129574581 [Sitodiplosis mosellana]|uniref:uncharacterized protein LOC129574581 n=1 Tax=Sitodiplosis mosellana TaxID=263140 RepID=UPI00244531CF|nr:uncharacterized protein LOC129574581 [Sitodiplosis mosellana]
MANKRKKINRQSNLKHKKRATNSGITTKIDDVNLDCLEHIFRFLHLEDLINVAQGNKHLKAAANMTFNHKFKMPIRLQNFNDVGECITICNQRNAIIIRNLKFIFKFLRLFGENISIVEVWPNDIRKAFKPEDIDIITYERILFYISEYCSKSLTSFTVIRHPDNVFIGMKNRFENVEIVETRMGNIASETLLQLESLFPRMRELRLIFYRSKVEFIKFPRLERLRIGIIGNNISNRENLVTAITLNAHLWGFELRDACDPNIWKLISTEMRSLKYLHMFYSFVHFKGFENTPIHFESVEELSLDLLRRNIEPKLIGVLTFSRLKVCTFYFFSKHLTPLLDFVAANPQIEKLVLFISLLNKNDLNTIGLAVEQYAALNPIQIELYLCSVICNVDDFLRFFKTNQYLSKIEAGFGNMSEIEYVRKQIAPEWKIIKIQSIIRKHFITISRL